MLIKLINHLSITLLFVLLISNNCDCAQADHNLPHLNQADQDLLRASRNNNLDLIRISIDNGANVNAQNHHGETPLMLTNNFRALESAQLLLDHGADVNIQNINGNTALIMALTINNIPKVQLLLDHGADVNIKNRFGESALTFAENQLMNPRIIELLKQHDDAHDSKPSKLL